MQYKKLLFRRIVAGALATTICTINSSALTKEIAVWGAQSINDFVNSDMRITMDDLKEDYEAFRDTGALVEYFHEDKSEPVKVDLGEAYSWLIDHGILSRDDKITISNATLTTIPEMTVEKSAVEDMYMNVNRSDLIMYLYKAVFGNLWGRTIGFESANVRVDDEKYKTLGQIIIDNNGTSEVNTVIKNDETNILNDSSNWRYFPQGTEFTSIFGDTNIFITQNDIQQNVNQGNDNTSIGGSAGSDNNTDQDLNYYADYKSIYYRPAADLWFYRTNDVLEMYLQAALSKGILEDEKHLRTEKFEDTFYHLAEDGAPVAAWSGDAYPYTPNRQLTQQYKLKNTEYAPLKDILGVNYTITGSGGNYIIDRQNLYESNSGYFTTEKIYKIDVYKYIYRFIYANEKKLSDLEVDIVNYKYGMDLAGIADDDEIEIIKYLIAKGILNYDITSEFRDLETPMRWIDFIELLYRVANPDARYDFSEVQLTDSENAWKAKGYAPQKLEVISANDFGIWTYDDEEFTIDDGSSGIVVGARIGTPVFAAETKTNTSKDTQKSVSSSIEPRQLLVGDYRFTTDLTGLGLIGALGDKQTLTNWFIRARQTIDELSDDNDTMTSLIRLATREEIFVPRDFDITDTEYLTVPKMITHMTLNNIHCVAALMNSSTYRQNVLDALNTAFADDKCKSEYSKKFAQLFKQQFERLYTDNNSFNLNYYQGNKSTKLALYNCSTISDFLNNVDKLQFFYKNSNGENTTLIITYNAKPEDFNIEIAKSKPDALSQSIADAEFDAYKNGNLKTKVTLLYTDGDKSGAQQKLSNSITTITAHATNSFSYVDDNGNIIMTGKEANTSGATGGLSSGSNSSNSNSSTKSVALQAFVDPTGKDAFISWSSISAYNKSVTDASMQIPITQVSELLLYNSATDTYAYFSDNKNSKIALVGTAVVTGDANLGVAFKSGDGESAEYYYHINAIKLLLDADQEIKVMSGIKGFELPDQTFANAVTTVPLASESGQAEFGVSGVKALLSSNDSSTSSSLSKDSVYFNLDAVNGERWGEFLTLSQANRVMNTITRRITYEVNGSMNGAYIVVVYEPVDVTSLGSQPMTSNISLQDVLDSPANPPSTTAGRKQWNENKALCNVFANWVYGTSGYEYISTGYLRPKAYIYVAPDCSKDIPAGYFEPLNDSQKAMIDIQQLNDFSGKVTKIGSSITGGESSCQYRLSSDYRVLVAGDRVYLNTGAFKGLEQYMGDLSTYAFKVANSTVKSAPFSIGAQVKLTDKTELSNGMPVPTATVVATSSDGYITCQLGPIVGTPIKIKDNETGIINSSILSEDVRNKPIDDVVGVPSYDVLKLIKNEMFNNLPSLYISSISTDANLNANGELGKNVAHFNGKTITVYTDGDIKNKAVSVNIKLKDEYGKNYTLSQYVSHITDLINTAKSGSNEINLATGLTSDDTYSYINFRFPAYQYSIVDGVLKFQNAVAADYISPSLFTSLNDLIIDEMISKSNGAIPINEIPAGSIVKIGTCYYTAVGSSTSKKEFIGYSAMNTVNENNSFVATHNLAAESFTTHFIRAGNQYINISHFFSEFTLLKNGDGSAVNALNIIKENTLAIDNNTKYSIDYDGDRELISSTPNDAGAINYTPVKIKFFNNLTAYRVSSPDSTVPRYEIVSFAQNAIGGAFDELPFWSDNLLTASLFDPTTTFMTGRFKLLEIVDEIANAFKENFAKAFQGDLFTLLRLVCFVILCWLMVASWVCYVFKLGGIAGIIEAINSPLSNKRGNGIDLFKIISAGTITIDSEFGLGRFLQYNLILGFLIFIIWRSGSLFM